MGLQKLSAITTAAVITLYCYAPISLIGPPRSLFFLCGADFSRNGLHTRTRIRTYICTCILVVVMCSGSFFFEQVCVCGVVLVGCVITCFLLFARTNVCFISSLQAVYEALQSNISFDFYFFVTAIHVLFWIVLIQCKSGWRKQRISGTSSLRFPAMSRKVSIEPSFF